MFCYDITGKRVEALLALLNQLKYQMDRIEAKVDAMRKS